MSFCKVLHGIQSGNDGDIDTARSLYMKILCTRARPLTFFVRQGKAPSEMLQNLAGSHDYFIGDTVCRFPMKKTRPNKYFSLKNISKKGTENAKNLKKSGDSRIFI